MIFADVAPFLWVFGSLFVAYVFFHKFSDVIKEKFRANTKAKNITSKQDTDIDHQFNQMLNNAPQIQAQVEAEISKQREKGVTDDQMKGLLNKKQMLDFAIQNKELIDIIGKPIIKKVLGMIKSI